MYGNQAATHPHPTLNPYPYAMRYNPHRHNPWGRGAKIAAALVGVSVVGLGVYLVWPKQASAATPTLPPPGPSTPKPTQPTTPKQPGGGGGGGGGAQTSIPSDAIGGGYDWQPRSQWKNYAEIVGGLAAFGYSVPSNYAQRPDDPTLMIDAQPAVKAFQRDYGPAVKFVSNWPLPAPSGTVDGNTAPRKSLGVDGWMGANTWPAFKWAYAQIIKYPAYQGKNAWADWVQGGKSI